MTTVANPMTTLRKRLIQAGIDNKYLNNVVLPEWWNDKIANEPAGYAEALIYISRHLGLESDSLRDEAAEVRFRKSCRPKYKKSAKLTEKDCLPVTSVAFRAATGAVLGVMGKLIPFEESPQQIRSSILKSSTIVNLGTLLDYCWNLGIPVLHIGDFPKEAKKVDGLCVKVNDRPVIVVCKKSKFPAWLVFVIAHELGHIFYRHLANAECHIDESIAGFKDVDGDEQLANTFASEVLTGRASPDFSTQYRMSGVKLAAEAIRYGKKVGIDPGVIALNHGWRMGAFGVANAALNHIEPDSESMSLIHRKMIENLDADEMPSETYEWLLRVTGAGAHV